MRITKISETSYPGVDDLIARTEKEGLEDGWTLAGLPDEFEQMVQAEIQIREGIINGDAATVPNDQIEKIRGWRQTVALRKQEHETRHTGDANTVSEQDFSWQR